MIATCVVFGLVAAAAARGDGPEQPSPALLKTVPIATTGVPPEWAHWERHVLDQLADAARAFVAKYTRPDGTIKWRDEWPGMDGSDDGYESFYNFPLYYALGGPEHIHRLSRKLWNGVTRQFTRYGQIDREFDKHYDWMHHGESYTYFYFFGLADPTVAPDRERALKFAAMYTGEDPLADNYDRHRKLIRSPINGSCGPHFANTPEDWITHRPILAHYPLPFSDIPGVASPAAWNDEARFASILGAINERMMRCDVPLNLTATSLVLNAYMYSGRAEYRDWIEQYVSAWMGRVAENNGILPDNVGPSGKIGETMQGKWWGGYYGWRWPHGLFNQLEATLIGATNAYLATGNPRFLDLPRSVLDTVLAQARRQDGQVTVPHKHGDEGWYEYRPVDAKYPIHLWYVSQADEDWRRLEQLHDPAHWNQLDYHKGKGDSDNPEAWVGFLLGQNRDYPVQILQACYEETLRRMELIQRDRTTPDEQDVHHWQKRNPVVLEGLVQLILGAPHHIYHGGLLHSRLWYFDPRRRRPGLPRDVAVLVDQIHPGSVSLHLVNLNPGQSRDVVLQAGAFGEHHFTTVKQVDHYPYQFHTIGGRHFRVRLAPAAVGRLVIEMDRYRHAPSYTAYEQ
jgi:hypothetical protein